MLSFKIFDTPVKVKWPIFVYLVVLWGGITWLGIHWHPGRGLWQGLLIGFVSMILLALSDFGHPIGHIFSARYAKAPMDEILLTEEMPRTLYWNNDVSPDVHRLRASGGLIFNLLLLLLSLGVYGIASSGSIARELATWSAVGHGLILTMSLVPVPMVDGGTILKWTLVARGKSETEADRLVRRVDWVLGIAAGVVGLVLLVLKMWIAGIVLVVACAVVKAIAAGKNR